jgi:hypothetical protein
MKLTDHLHLFQRLRMGGAIPSLTDIISWPSQGRPYLYCVVYRKCEADVSEMYV